MRLAPEELPRVVAGYLVLVLALLLGLALVSFHPLDPSWLSAGSSQARNWLGTVGAWVAGVLVRLFGVWALLLPVVLLRVGWQWLRGRPLESPASAFLFFLLALLFGAGLFACFAGPIAYRGGELDLGGEAGLLVFRGLSASLGLVGAYVVCFAGLLAGASFGLRRHPLFVALSLRQYWHRRLGELRARASRLRQSRKRRKLEKKLLLRQMAKNQEPDPPMVWRVATVGGSRLRRLPRWPTEPKQTKPSRPPAVKPPAVFPEVMEPEPEVFSQQVFSFLLETPPSPLPDLSLLDPPAPGVLPSANELALMRQALEAKFREFKVDGRVEGVMPGPVITTFEFQPAPGVKYAQIVSLEEDLALKLGVEAVRLERIPGKTTVGVEVPNPHRQTIVLREILESSRFANSPSPLTLALGKDIQGNPVVADLARMPHLLIGGFTGSGKSVGINAMVMSVLFKATPETVRFIFIDPKMVELGMYEKLPHLLTPIVSDPRVAARVLAWAVRTMRERYQLLAACQVRNIQQYNELLARREEREALEKSQQRSLTPLPYLVIVIDELADLMMTAPKEVEDSIVKLAQMARAVGIHLIVATQRPSVDVVTGIIKANFTSRIAYKVRVRADSRTILDADGAERLLGQGDMLYLPPGSARPIRLHGPLVREEEILRVIKHYSRLGKPVYDESILAEESLEEEGEGGSWDPMYDQAARLVVRTRKASASYIQRKLRLGYARAARLLDVMEQRGLVGPAQGSRGREVLVPADYFEEGQPTMAAEEEEDV
ncbi:MAG: DNA translocase FtsK 4TM domain-containing protein [Thermoanaerobaculaceae bacterium]